MEGPLHAIELRRKQLVVVGLGRIGEHGDPMGQIVQAGGDRGDLGANGHAPMMADAKPGGTTARFGARRAGPGPLLG